LVDLSRWRAGRNLPFGIVGVDAAFNGWAAHVAALTGSQYQQIQREQRRCKRARRLPAACQKATNAMENNGTSVRTAGMVDSRLDVTISS
jgi:hypothetical protein